MEMRIHIRIRAAPEWSRTGAHARVKQALRRALALSTSRIREVAVCLEDLFETKGRYGWECRLYAWLLPAGTRSTRSAGDCFEAALQRATELLIRSLDTADVVVDDEQSGQVDQVELCSVQTYGE